MAISFQRAAGIISDKTVPSPWTPAEISTLIWLDASDTGSITESGGKVSQWNDQDGSNHVSQATGARQPTTGVATINGLNAIRWNGAFESMVTTGNPYTSPIGSAFVIALLKYPNPLDTGAIFNLTGNPSTNRWLLQTASAGDASFTADGSGQITTDTSFVAADETMIVAAEQDNVADDRSIWKNAAVYATDTVNGTVGSLVDVVVGGADEGSNCLEHDLGEIIFIEGTVSDSDRERLEGYLAHKWGQESLLPGGHPYKSSPPTS